MAEGTYEFECMRAELLGIDKPNEEQFEIARAERLKIEQEELEAQQANQLDDQDESLSNTGGKLDELNSILSATQLKLNRFKKTACGSLTNMFSKGSMDEPDKTEPGEGSSTQSTNINEALENLDEMKTVNQQKDVHVAKNASLDIQQKMTSHLDKLDSLISKADDAQHAMQAQNQQMRKYMK